MSILRPHFLQNEALDKAHYKLLPSFKEREGFRSFRYYYLKAYDRDPFSERQVAKLTPLIEGYFSKTKSLTDLQKAISASNPYYSVDHYHHGPSYLVDDKEQTFKLKIAPLLLKGVSAWAKTVDPTITPAKAFDEVRTYISNIWLPNPYERWRREYDETSLTAALLGGAVFPSEKENLQIAMIKTAMERLDKLEGRIEKTGLSLPAKVPDPSPVVASYAAITGNMKVMKALEQDISSLVSWEGLRTAVATGHPEYVQYLEEKKFLSDGPNGLIRAASGFYSASEEDWGAANAHSFEHLLGKYTRKTGEFYNPPDLYEAPQTWAKFNRADFFRIAVEQGHKFHSDYLTKALNECVKYGSLETLDYLLGEILSRRMQFSGSDHSHYPDYPEGMDFSTMVHKHLTGGFTFHIHGRAHLKIKPAPHDLAMLDVLRKHGAPPGQEKRDVYDENMKSYVHSGKIPYAYIRHLLHSNWNGINPDFFLQVLNMLRVEKYSSTQETAQHLAYTACVFFKKPQYLVDYMARGATGPTPLHDMLQALQIDPSLLRPQRAAAREAERKSIMRQWRDAAVSIGPRMAELIRYTTLKNGLVPQRNQHSALSVEETRGRISQTVFGPDADLAKIALSLGADRRDILESKKLIQRKSRLVANDNDPENYLPDLEIDGTQFDMPGTVFCKLEYNDPRGPMIGAVTKCCQRLNHSSGVDSIRHAYETNHSWLYVIKRRDSGSILGHTWVWRGKEKGQICFENAEREDKKVPPAAWEKLFGILPEEIKKDPQAENLQLFVGRSNKMPNLLKVKNSDEKLVWKLGDKPAAPQNYSGYRESAQQYTLR
jgi:hypothetical protein